MKTRICFLLIIVMLTGCSQYSKVQPPPVSVEETPLKNHPKNIILMIGDGMGLTQITAGMYINGNKLHLEQFPVVGLHKTYASNNLVTDSASGATAFASGVKTYNSAIGVDVDTQSVKTILEEAYSYGLATGLVATSTITHATPAAFIAHVKSRNMHEEIAEFFLKTEIDLFIGGGKKFFHSREKDDQNLIAQLEQKGYFISDFIRENLSEIPIDFNRKFGYFTSDSDPPPYSQGRDYLAPASKLATVYLNRRSEKGFFLMIEGSQIDWGGHANDSNYIISEVIDFDNAIGEVLAFARQDGETLVIVTADHETGGYSINHGSTMDSIVGSFSTDYHTATLIPVFAFGPGAELFNGIYENTAIYEKMRTAFGFDKLKE